MLLAVLVLFVSTTGAALVQFSKNGLDWYDGKYRWRDDEYAKLARLHAGFTLGTFKAALGEPAFVRPSRSGAWVESVFRGRDYWVQALTLRSSPTVQFFSVTSCSLNFNPRFKLVDSTPIVLNKDRLASVRRGRYAAADSIDYFLPAATANAHLYETSYGGNPGLYKSFLWGYNDACLDLPGWYEVIPARILGSFESTYYGDPNAENPDLQEIRRSVLVNTFAESAPQRQFGELSGHFQIGIDRIQIRAVTHPSYEPEPPPSGYEQVQPPEPAPSPPGSARLQKAWSCLHSPLVLPFGSVYGSDERSITGAARRYARYASGGYLIVEAVLPDRGTSRQSVTIFFAKDDAGALRVAAALRERERGVVMVVRDSVLLWRLPPRADERRSLYPCGFETYR